MKTTIESVGRNVAEAIEEGLKKLHIKLDDADIKIISSGGLFKKAKVEITVGTDDPVKPEPKSEEKPIKAQAEAKKPFEPKKEEKQPVKEENKKSFEHKPEPKKEEKKPFEQKTEVKREEKKPFEQKSELNKEEKKPFVFKSEDKREDRAREQKPQGFKEKEPRIQGNKERDSKPRFDFKPNHKERKFEEREFISVPATEEQKNACAKFLTELLEKMGVNATLDIGDTEGLNIKIITEDSCVIGHRGETLDALQYLTSLVLNDKDGKNVLLTVDAFDYRVRRINTLKDLAVKKAEKCVSTNRKVPLEPMSSAERRVIHAALSENPSVITRSEGHEPARRVVIIPRNAN